MTTVTITVKSVIVIGVELGQEKEDKIKIFLSHPFLKSFLHRKLVHIPYYII